MRPSHVVCCGRPRPLSVSLDTLTVTSLAMLLSVFGQGDLALDASSKDQDHPRLGGSARMSHRPHDKCQMRASALWSREIGTSRLGPMARSVHGVFILARGNMRVSALGGPSNRGDPRTHPGAYLKARTLPYQPIESQGEKVVWRASSFETFVMLSRSVSEEPDRRTRAQIRRSDYRRNPLWLNRCGTPGQAGVPTVATPIGRPLKKITG